MKFAKKYFKEFVSIIVHLLFWIGVYFFFTYYLGYGSTNTAYINRFAFYLMPITMALGYFFFYFLIPKYLLVKKHFQFGVYSIYTFIISFFFIALSIFYGMVLSHKLVIEETNPLTKTVPYIIFGVYFVTLLVIVLGLLINNYKASLKSEDLKNKFLATQLQLKEQELKYLKMQIHPHFLFNTLNTLYGFALKKSEKTPEVILKLSGLLDYILYQVNKPLVLLEDEIQHIKNYITLEKIRFSNQLDIEFNHSKNQNNLMIPPMLLLPFVENAFKHGTRVNGVLSISLSIEVKNNYLFFTCKNSTKPKELENKGIGLTNIKERLEKLFEDDYILTISEETNQFSSFLKIPIQND
ncbi:sensor histidine kinase [Tenacibaculum sp. MEBiC06402]|uniref:sensor histidine kinase n=1 Tax=unclassified Tenacibaculum TaxID=2635139 RepID=UPI003B996430